MTLNSGAEAINLAVDIGGSKTIVALAYQNKIIATKQIPTSQNGFDEFLRDFYLAFTNLCSESSVSPKSIVSAVVASPGLLDIKNGVVIRAINLDWNSVSLVESFRNLLGFEKRQICPEIPTPLIPGLSGRGDHPCDPNHCHIRTSVHNAM